MEPRDKYTTFSKTTKGFRKSVHKVSACGMVAVLLGVSARGEMSLRVWSPRHDVRIIPLMPHLFHVLPRHAGTEMDKAHPQNKSKGFLILL